MKALVVVDVQNDFITGSLGSVKAERVLPNIIEKIYNFDGNIFCTLDNHLEDYLTTQEGRNLPVEHCIIGTTGFDMPDAVVDILKHKNCAFVNKETFGAKYLPEIIKDSIPFNLKDSIPFDVNLEIELIGYVLDICVISNALLLKAHFPETKILVDVSCCAATSPEAFEAAKIILKSCQIEIRGDNK